VPPARVSLQRLLRPVPGGDGLGGDAGGDLPGEHRQVDPAAGDRLGLVGRVADQHHAIPDQILDRAPDRDAAQHHGQDGRTGEAALDKRIQVILGAAAIFHLRGGDHQADIGFVRPLGEDPAIPARREFGADVVLALAGIVQRDASQQVLEPRVVVGHARHRAQPGP